MKTTCHNGKHLCRGNRKKQRLKVEYQSAQFPLAGPCNDMHTSSQSLRYDGRKREVKSPLSDHTHIGNRWSVDGNLSDLPQ